MTFNEKQRILTENLREFSKKQSLASAQKELTALEISRLCSESLSSLDDILETFENLSEEFSPKDEIIFLSELCNSELMPKIKELLFIGSTEPTSAGAHSKISYFKSRYNDMAFEHFSRSVANAKPDYASSFTESCENVFDGRCEYCIIPLMNSTDGRLMSFYSLLDRYELKICATVNIDGEDSSSTVKHALLSRACEEKKGRIPKNQKYIFEFSIIDENTDFFASLFEAANYLDAKLTCIDSIPMEYAPHTQKFFFSFCLPYYNALALRLFISLKHPAYMPIGFYKDT